MTMPLTRIEINCSTGEPVVVPLAPEEEAEVAAQREEGAVVAAAEAAVAQTAQTIRASFDQAMTRSAQIKTQMDAIQAATFANNGQRDLAIKSISEAVEDLNTGLRKLIRLVDNRLDAAD